MLTGFLRSGSIVAAVSNDRGKGMMYSGFAIGARADLSGSQWTSPSGIGPNVAAAGAGCNRRRVDVLAH